MDEEWTDVMHESPEFELSSPIQNIKSQLLHKSIYCLIQILGGSGISNELIRKEKLNFNKLQLLKNIISSTNNNEFEKNICLYHSMIDENIPVRIYFVIGKNIDTFIECYIMDGIIEHKNKYKDVVLGVDDAFNVSDQTYYFSNEMRRHGIFKQIIDELSFAINNIRENCMFNKYKKETNIFQELDYARYRPIPTSLKKMKLHPLYTIESILSNNQAIFPLRGIKGVFKGEHVFPKTNIIKLETKNQLYKRGMKVISKKPFRKRNGIEYYASWQYEPIRIHSMSKDSQYMDYFHENFIPETCLYSENDESAVVAKLLRIEFKYCTVGFSNKHPVTQGIFIKKKDSFVFFNFLNEFIEICKVKDDVECRKMLFKNWAKLYKRVIRYLEIIKNL
ncbi:DNA repair protein RAD4 [Astathelohania contejeani]|uniref:DNA repair protein RAD4 n=1 Tax=Astathelohania contejeani TaxID=164912 RepID=A0ABQ7HXT5_9MICR|nr:DNA repair protein RAD4 [Thelohania contejeani]